MQRCLIVLEPTDTGFSAYSPDLPGCIATGTTRVEVEASMRQAVALHLDGLREDGGPCRHRTPSRLISRSLPNTACSWRRGCGARGRARRVRRALR